MEEWKTMILEVMRGEEAKWSEGVSLLRRVTTYLPVDLIENRGERG